jgi:hypothetical protein
LEAFVARSWRRVLKKPTLRCIVRARRDTSISNAVERVASCQRRRVDTRHLAAEVVHCQRKHPAAQTEKPEAKKPHALDLERQLIEILIGSSGRQLEIGRRTAHVHERSPPSPVSGCLLRHRLEVELSHRT